MTDNEKKAWELVEKAGAKLGETVDKLGPAAVRYVSADAWVTVIAALAVAIAVVFLVRWLLTLEIEDEFARGMVRGWSVALGCAAVLACIGIAASNAGAAIEPLGYLVTSAVAKAAR